MRVAHCLSECRRASTRAQHLRDTKAFRTRPGRPATRRPWTANEVRPSRLERTQEVQDRLLVRHSQGFEFAHNGICLRTVGAVRSDGLQQIVGPSVMQEEYSLTDAPKRRRAELTWTSLALADPVGEPCAHVMQQQVGKQIDGPVLQYRAKQNRRSLHCWRVAQRTPDATKNVLAMSRASARSGVRLRAIGKPHQQSELHPVREDVKRIVEGLINFVVLVHSRHIIWLRLLWTIAVRIFFFCLGEQLVGDAHFDVLGFPREHSKRLVLRLPAEAGNGPIVTASIWATGDAESRALI